MNCCTTFKLKHTSITRSAFSPSSAHRRSTLDTKSPGFRTHSRFSPRNVSGYWFISHGMRRAQKYSYTTLPVSDMKARPVATDSGYLLATSSIIPTTSLNNPPSPNRASA